MTTTLPILLGWRAEDCWSLWFVGIGGAALRLLQAGFCGMLCLPVTSGARICGPGAALKRLLSSRELLVLRPYSQPLKHPRVSLLISPAPGAWLSLGRQPHARLDPHAHFFKPPRFFPVFLLKKKSWLLPAPRSGCALLPRGAPWSGVTAPPCQHRSPRQGFQRHSEVSELRRNKIEQRPAPRIKKSCIITPARSNVSCCDSRNGVWVTSSGAIFRTWRGTRCSLKISIYRVQVTKKKLIRKSLRCQKFFLTQNKHQLLLYYIY